MQHILVQIEKELETLDLPWNSPRVTSIAPFIPEATEEALQSLLDALRTPIVINLKTYKGADVVKVDRSTALGNPFWMKDESQRDLVCEAQRLHLWELHKSGFREDPRKLAVAIVSKPDFSGLSVSQNYRWKAYEVKESMNYLIQSKEGRVQKLGCHCAPRRCHGHTEARYIMQRLSGRI